MKSRCRGILLFVFISFSIAHAAERPPLHYEVTTEIDGRPIRITQDFVLKEEGKGSVKAIPYTDRLAFDSQEPMPPKTCMTNLTFELGRTLTTVVDLSSSVTLYSNESPLTFGRSYESPMAGADDGRPKCKPAFPKGEMDLRILFLSEHKLKVADEKWIILMMNLNEYPQGPGLPGLLSTKKGKPYFVFADEPEAQFLMQIPAYSFSAVIFLPQSSRNDVKIATNYVSGTFLSQQALNK